MKNTAEVIKGISMMVEGLSLIKNALSADIPIQDTDTADVKAVYDKPEIKVDVTPETPETPETIEEKKKYGNYTLDEIRGMSYNAFKKAAATIGVKCTGTRDEIMSRILALDTVEEVKEETPIKSKTAPKQAKTDKPVKVSKEEPKKDEYDTQAEQIVKSTDKEEITAALEDVGIEVDSDSDLTTLLAKALRDGLLETEDEDDTDESESEEEDDELDSEDTADDDDDDEEEITPTSYFPEYDEEEYNNPDEMTTNRKKAVEKEVENILADYDNGDSTEKEIMAFLTEFCTEEELDLVKGADEKEQLKLFIEMSKRFIDNDGEKIEPNNPYELGEHDMCCGHELKYNKKSKTYICEHCGEEYEAE